VFFVILFLITFAGVEAQDEVVKYSYKNEHATPAKHIEVVYREGNAYIKLDCGPGYEPYIGYWRNGKEIWLEGARLGRESDDFVLYSVPLERRVTATDAYTGVTTFFYPVKFGGVQIDKVTLDGDALTFTVGGRKFVAREAK
jgi:hypothetical protein